MRNCPTKIQNINEQHINQLAMFMETAMMSRDEEIAGEEIFAIMEQEQQEEDNDLITLAAQDEQQDEVETDLIDLNTQDVVGVDNTPTGF